MNAAGTAVIVEDDILICMMFEDVCRETGIEVVGTAGDAERAVPLIEAHDLTHLVLDYRLKGGRSGLDILAEVRPTLDRTKIIFITGSNEPETVAAIRRAQPDAVLIKPILEADFVSALSA